MVSIGVFLLLSSAAYAIKIPVDKSKIKKVEEVYTKVWEKIYGGKEDDVAYGIVAL
jgi:hypothetical protein